MQTEELASLKRCCGPGDCGRPGNPDESGFRDRYCIATECMAWRKMPRGPNRYFVTFNDKPEEEWNCNPTNHKGYEGAVVRIVPPDTFGYCGLAGKVVFP